MAEHDDALLDDDIASLPDISDEDYEDIDEVFLPIDYSSNEDKINDTVENKFDTLDLKELDEFNEFKKELKETELNNSLKSNNDLLYNQELCEENNEDYRSLINNSNESSDTNIQKYDLRLKLHNLHKQRVINNIDDVNNEGNPNMIRIQSDNDCLPYLNVSESVGSIRRKCDINEPDRCSFMRNEPSPNFTNFSHPQIMNHPYNFQMTDNFNPHVMPTTSGVQSTFYNDPFHTFLPDQSQFFYNQNMCGNYAMERPQMQQASFSVNPNVLVHQAFPVHQILPMNQPMPFVPRHAGGVMPNLNVNQTVMSNYPQPMFSYEPHADLNLPQYAAKPFNYNGHKILVNRDFRKSETEREVKILPNDMEYNEFLKMNSTFSNPHKSFKSYQYLKNDDPYSYFSDVWQEKKAKKNELRNFSREAMFSKVNEFNKSKSKLRKQNNKEDLELFLLGKNEVLPTSKMSKMSFSQRYDDENLRTVKKIAELQKRKNRIIVKNQSIDKNNNSYKKHDFQKQKTSIENIFVQDRNIKKTLRREVELDPQMKEYCRKVEEQKLVREKFLLEKENRRKLLAMEKLGIKKEAFIETIDLEIQEIIDVESACQQEIKAVEDPPIIELDN